MSDQPINLKFSGAFSLIEVVVSLGIVAVALLSLLGLMSLGVDSQKETEVRVSAARLAANVFDEMKGERFWEFVPPDGTVPPDRYYDSELRYIGKETDAPRDLLEITYAVEVEVIREKALTSLKLTVLHPGNPEVPRNRKAVFRYYSKLYKP